MKKHFKRQEISPGVILEKYQEENNSSKVYILKIETLVFKSVEFEVDFNGSSNIKVRGSDNFICRKLILPFEKTTVAVLDLETGWELKTKFKFSCDTPSLEIQEKRLKPIETEIQEEKKKTDLLENFDVNSIAENELFSYLQKRKAIFIDHDFPPEKSSIDINPEYTISNFNSIGHWRRARHLLLKDHVSKEEDCIVELYNKEVKPEYITQGEVANCWMLSVIAALAENPRMIRRVILNKKANPFGLVRIKLCDMANWVIFSLDDYFPCYPLGLPFFTQNKEKELWPMILEKAFAKKYGSYSRLAKGNCKQAFVDLTGCPTFQYKFEDPDFKEKIDSGEIWNLLKEWKSLKYYLTVGSRTVVKDNETFNLPSEHAYTFLNIFRTEKVIELRDPLKIKNFTGKLSENSKLWTDELRNQIRPKFNSNRIYVTYEEFLEFFDIITVCQLASWNEIKIKGKFVKSQDSENKTQEHFCSKWLYKIKIEKKSTILIGLHQKDERCLGVKETTPYTDLGFVVLTIKNNSYTLVAEFQNRYEREIFETLKLDPGIYYIVPRSSGMILFNKIKTKPFNCHLDDFRIKAIANDTFEKLDIDDNGILSMSELKIFFSHIGQNLEEKEFSKLLNKYTTEEFPSLSNQNLNSKIFLLFFKDVLRTLPMNRRRDLFKKLGYSVDLQSLRNRLFRMTIHTKDDVAMKTDDALKDAIDQTSIRLLLRNKGLDLSTKQKVKLEEGKVKCLYFFNP